MNKTKITSWLISITLIFSFFVSNSVSGSFSDVPDDHPYIKAIEYLQNNDIVQGYEDGTFRPEQTINRAEFTKVLLEIAQPGKRVKVGNLRRRY